MESLFRASTSSGQPRPCPACPLWPGTRGRGGEGERGSKKKRSSLVLVCVFVCLPACVVRLLVFPFLGSVYFFRGCQEQGFWLTDHGLGRGVLFHRVLTWVNLAAVLTRSRCQSLRCILLHMSNIIFRKSVFCTAHLD